MGIENSPSSLPDGKLVVEISATGDTGGPSDVLADEPHVSHGVVVGIFQRAYERRMAAQTEPTSSVAPGGAEL